MTLEDFDFELPQTGIALRPAVPRDSAGLFVVEPNANPPFFNASVRDLPGLLRSGDVMVFNNTKVLRAEFHGVRERRDAKSPPVPVSVNLLERLGDGSWRALARPRRRLRIGDIVDLDDRGGRSALRVDNLEPDGPIIVSSIGGSIEAMMESHGRMPLPPYISRIRSSDERDISDYQTAYAEREGAVAAPTAGLHFTPDLFKRIDEARVRRVFVTLHVGAGTFLPMRAENIHDHKIHAEYCEISEQAASEIEECRSKGGRLIAAGTTTLRVLETAAAEDRSILPYRGMTELFIKPGYRFRTADLLLTNFHLPRSTLFMLVCAFSGTGLMKKAYAHAVASGFRFYSYGDATLLYRAPEQGPR